MGHTVLGLDPTRARFPSGLFHTSFSFPSEPCLPPLQGNHNIPSSWLWGAACSDSARYLTSASGLCSPRERDGVRPAPDPARSTDGRLLSEGHNSRKRCSRLHVWSFEPARLTYEPFQDQPTQRWATNNVEPGTHLSCLSPDIRAPFSLLYLSLLRPRPDSARLALWCGPSFHPNPFDCPVWEPWTWQCS